MVQRKVNSLLDCTVHLDYWLIYGWLDDISGANCQFEVTPPTLVISGVDTVHLDIGYRWLVYNHQFEFTPPTLVISGY